MSNLESPSSSPPLVFSSTSSQSNESKMKMNKDERSAGNNSSSSAVSKRKANRVQRACFNCRKRKQGCEEERPCRRCIERGIECVEVETKRKRGRNNPLKGSGETRSSSKGEGRERTHHHRAKYSSEDYGKGTRQSNSQMRWAISDHRWVQFE